ncbi:YfhO family protein [Marinoscillum furvescens]|nr:YfhO family protein [Marinoscillum furvescens]
MQAKGASHQLSEYRELTGEQALWMFNMFSGMPAYLNGVRFSGDFLDDVQKLLHLGIPRPAQIIFLTCLSFYLMLLAFRVRPWVAFIGALIFGFNGFNVIGIIAGHNAKIQAVAYMPLVIAGMKLTFDKKWLLGLSVFALGLGLNLHADHLQITYYLLIITILYGIAEFVVALREKHAPVFLKSAGVLVLGAVLAVGANFGKLWTVIEYSEHSTRGQKELTKVSENKTGLDKSYAFQYSNGIFEPLVMFIPNVLGGASSTPLDRDSNVGNALRNAGYNGAQLDQQLQNIPTYWGDQPLTAPYYLSSALLLILVLGFLYASKKERYWISVLVCLAIVLSWGSNFAGFNDFVFDTVPGYNKFRSVTFTIIMAMFGLVLISILGLDRFISDENKNQFKKLKTAFTISGGFVLFLLIFSAFLGYKGAIDQRIGADWFVEALRDDRAALFRQDIWRSIILILVLVGLLWALIKEKFNQTALLAAVLLLFTFDVVGLSKRFLKDNVFKRKPANELAFQATPADQVIMNESKPAQRVLNLQNPFNDAGTSFFHESIGGYHGAKMMRYQDLIEHHLSNEIASVISGLQEGERTFDNIPALNMLNTRFLKAGEGKNAVLENKKAYGEAWIVNDIKKVQTPDEEIANLDEVNLKETAIINATQFDVSQNLSGSGSITLVDKTPNMVKYKTSTQGGNSLGVLSEIYYPEGWTATIDGQEASIIRVNYVLRAIVLPSGEHEVTLSFEPNSYYVGAKVTLVFNILVLLLFLGAISFETRKYFKQA